MRGNEEKEVVMMMMEEDEEGSDRGREREVVTWDEFLPKGSLRVLLVEGDDSTRQIIAALLRKCNYKVVAVSDGKKAWEMLKERPHSIDVILTELEVPSISGISLLTMIMDHETFKNIPVIMMSSNDSINMVFNCMLRGAADFLVKPVRKNELSNLWQHVWRRKTLTDSHGGTNVHLCDDQAKQKLEDNPQRGNQLNGSQPSIRQKEERSEKGSDAESSCTRSDMEAESTYKQHSLESQQPTSKNFPPSNGTICQNDRQQISEQLLETMNEDVQLTGSVHDNKTTINLIGRIDHQRDFSFGGDIADARESVYHRKDFHCEPSSTPQLELSLRRYSSPEEEEKTERHTLNHSDSSAFSLYNGRMPVSSSLRAASFQAEFDNYPSSTIIKVPDKDRVIKCSPLRVIPVTNSDQGISSDRVRYDTVSQPVIFANSSAFPLWSAVSSTDHEAVHTNSSRQSDTRGDCSSSQSHQWNHQSAPIEDASAVELRDEDELQHVNSRAIGGISCINNENIGTVSSSQPELHNLSAREAALNKFRLKRKERCFEKKVRYQSRKRLAEQRPRVKGQFVRHIQPEAEPAGA